MSLLTVCQNVLAETGWPIAGAIATNSDLTAKQIFAIANTELRALCELYDWPQLETEYTFNLLPGQSVYLWPADFRVMAPLGMFDAEQYYSVKGSTGIPYWQMLKEGRLSNLNRARFRVTFPLGAPGVEFTPAPDTIGARLAVYYSKCYVRNNIGENIAQYLADTDVSRIPERYVELGVKWRFRRAKGLDFSAELAEYNSTVQAQFSRHVASGAITIGGPRGFIETTGLAPGYVRDYGFGV